MSLLNQIRQWILISTYLIIVSAEIVPFQHFEIYSGYGKRPSVVTDGLYNEVGIDQASCIKKCTEMNCVAASYDNATQFCGYYYHRHTAIFPEETRNFIKVKDIKVSSVMLVPNTQFELHQVEWTVTDAIERCEAVGQHLMTFEQLNNIVINEGYHYCGCGFIDGGQMVVAVGYTGSSCGDIVGVHSCREANYAFCTTDLV